MKRLTRLLSFAALIALTLAFSVPALALTPMDNFYVNDYVGVLSSSDKQDMFDRANRLCEENGVQVVAVVVDNYVGSSIDDYATKLFNEWGIGQKHDNNGVLLVVATEDRDVCIRVGDGMEAQLTDSKCGRILDDYFIPYAAKNNFGDAVYNTFIKLISEGSRLETRGVIQKSYTWVVSMVKLIAILVFVLIFAYITRHGYRRSYYRRHGCYPPYRGHRHNHHHSGSHYVSHDHHSGGGGHSSGGGSSRSFGSSRSSSSRSSSSRSSSRSSGGSSRSSGGGGRSSGGGSSRKF